MSNPNKARGTRFESATVEVLRATGIATARLRRQAGAKDEGDIEGVHPFTIECKDEARLDFSGYLAQAKAEANNAGGDFAVAVVKRRGRNASHAYAVTDLDTLARIMARLRELENTAARQSVVIEELRRP